MLKIFLLVGTVSVAAFSFPADFLKKVIFQRNQVAAAEICLPAGFFLDNTHLLCLIWALPTSDLKPVSGAVVGARYSQSLKQQMRFFVTIEDPRPGGRGGGPGCVRPGSAPAPPVRWRLIFKPAQGRCFLIGVTLQGAEGDCDEGFDGQVCYRLLKASRRAVPVTAPGCVGGMEQGLSSSTAALQKCHCWLF